MKAIAVTVGREKFVFALAPEDLMAISTQNNHNALESIAEIISHRSLEETDRASKRRQILTPFPQKKPLQLSDSQRQDLEKLTNTREIDGYLPYEISPIATNRNLSLMGLIQASLDLNLARQTAQKMLDQDKNLKNTPGIEEAYTKKEESLKNLRAYQNQRNLLAAQGVYKATEAYLSYKGMSYQAENILPQPWTTCAALIMATAAFTQSIEVLEGAYIAHIESASEQGQIENQFQFDAKTLQLAKEINEIDLDTQDTEQLKESYQAFVDAHQSVAESIENSRNNRLTSTKLTQNYRVLSHIINLFAGLIQLAMPLVAEIRSTSHRERRV